MKAKSKVSLFEIRNWGDFHDVEIILENLHKDEQTEKNPGPPPKTVSDQLFDGLKPPLKASAEENKSTTAKNSSKLTCHTCNFTSDTLEAFRDHYKCEWHQMNLKLQQKGKPPICELEFRRISEIDSSISCSDLDYASSDEDSQTFSSKQTPASLFNFPSSQILLKSSSSQLYFSVYRTILSERSKSTLSSAPSQVLPAHIRHFFSNFRIAPSHEMSEAKPQVIWGIFMCSSGHFAGGFFEQGNLIASKTFHRYVVRKKRGTSQSFHDNSTGGKAKSAGASLRRYNEAAFKEDILAQFTSWQNLFSACTHIFVSSPGRNENSLFSAKSSAKDSSLLQRSDMRIRRVPFECKRPTISELKRIHQQLASVYFYDPVEVANYISSIHINSASSLIPSPSLLEADSSACSSIPSQHVLLPASRCPNQAQASVQTVGEAAAEVSAQEEEQEGKMDATKDTLKEKPEENEENEEAKVECLLTMSPEFPFESCKDGNLLIITQFINSLHHQNRDPSLSSPDPLHQFAFTPLHYASFYDHPKIVQHLLENGSDPTILDSRSRSAYRVSQSKLVRDEFRKFMARFPDRWDYSLADIPSGLTAEMEALRLEKERLREEKLKQKRQKEKQKKKEKQRLEKIQSDSSKIAAAKSAPSSAPTSAPSCASNLSDRELRALAAEKRMMHQSQPIRSSSSFCADCGVSLENRVPFSRLEFSYCSISCVANHRLKLG